VGVRTYEGLHKIITALAWAALHELHRVDKAGAALHVNALSTPLAP